MHVPIGDWYWYDLEYWGLDYPPITAYVSYLCGLGSHHLVGPETVALEASRGIEDRTHKAYMRATVLVLDLLVYGSAVWLACNRSKKFTNQPNKSDQFSLWMMLLALSQPAIILIDHGHFQYNTVALGWSITAFYFMTKGSDFFNCIIGSIFFCLALNFKQMTLYYAPVVFAYLLGRCFSDRQRLVQRFVYLGITVIITFGLMWAPFFLNGPSNHEEVTILGRGLQILKRIFPFQRGLFESKVANLWCALSTKPISIRDHLPADLQPILALGLTVVLMLPSCVALFRVGTITIATSTKVHNDANTNANANDDLHWKSMLWGATSCSLSFFLASFQVHEKSILIALAPAALLLDSDESFVQYFSIACAWSLWPLLQVDQLDLAYTCMMIIFGCLLWLYHGNKKPTDGMTVDRKQQISFFSSYFYPIPILAYAGMMGLHVMQIIVSAPSNLPDLYPVLWSVAGCGMFLVAWACSLWHLLVLDRSQTALGQAAIATPGGNKLKLK